MLRRASRVRSSSAWTDLNRPAARPEACDPAVSRSSTVTDRPASAQCKAVLRPSAPAPITTTSASTTPLLPADNQEATERGRLSRGPAPRLHRPAAARDAGPPSFRVSLADQAQRDPAECLLNLAPLLGVDLVLLQPAPQLAHQPGLPRGGDPVYLGLPAFGQHQYTGVVAGQVAGRDDVAEERPQHPRRHPHRGLDVRFPSRPPERLLADEHPISPHTVARSSVVPESARMPASEDRLSRRRIWRRWRARWPAGRAPSAASAARTRWPTPRSRTGGTWA